MKARGLPPMLDDTDTTEVRDIQANIHSCFKSNPDIISAAQSIIRDTSALFEVPDLHLM